MFGFYVQTSINLTFSNTVVPPGEFHYPHERTACGEDELDTGNNPSVNNKQWFSYVFGCQRNKWTLWNHKDNDPSIPDSARVNWDCFKHTRWHEKFLVHVRRCLYGFNRTSVCVCEQNVCWRWPWRSSESFCRSGSPRPSSTVTTWSSSSFRPPWLNCERWSWIFLLQVNSSNKCDTKTYSSCCLH